MHLLQVQIAYTYSYIFQNIIAYCIEILIYVFIRVPQNLKSEFLKLLISFYIGFLIFGKRMLYSVYFNYYHLA